MAKQRDATTKERDHLIVAVSRDEAESWGDVARLDPPPDKRGRNMQGMMFHYPTLLPREVSARTPRGVAVAAVETTTGEEIGSTGHSSTPGMGQNSKHSPPPRDG